MDFATISKIILFAIALSMDAFAVSITDGLIYTDLNKKKAFFIAIVFGVLQGLMPLIGYWLIEIIAVSVGSTAGATASSVVSTCVTWISFALLLFIGGKMLFEGIKATIKKEEETEPKKFSYKEVLLFGIATSIDALATGIAFHSGISTNVTIWLHISIIIVITFAFSICGVLLGNFFDKLLHGKYEITNIIGGAILLGLAVRIVVSFYI